MAKLQSMTCWFSWVISLASQIARVILTAMALYPLLICSCSWVLLANSVDRDRSCHHSQLYP